MNDLERIEQRYNLRLPEDYLSMQAMGWFDVKSPDYFWIYEAEWMSLEEIAEHEPAEYHKPGYVPFAFTAGGDHWCWWPSEHPGAVVLCPHDCNEGEFDAPSFVGFLYRRLLEYAWYIHDEEGGEDDVRRGLRDSTLRLTPYLPASWRDTLNALASAPLDPAVHSQRQRCGLESDNR